MADDDIRAIQAVLVRRVEAGLSLEAALEEIYKEFPGVQPEVLIVAVKAFAEELEIEAARHEGEARALKRMVELIKRAEAESGKKGLQAEEALTFLAERGDAEAQAFLDELISPESLAFQAELEEAVEWHPEWRKEGDRFIWEGDTELDTPEKLVAAYRDFRRK